MPPTGGTAGRENFALWIWEFKIEANQLGKRLLILRRFLFFLMVPDVARWLDSVGALETTSP